MDESAPDRGTFGHLDIPDWRERDRLPREYGLPESAGPEHLSEVLPKDVADEIKYWRYIVPINVGVLYQHMTGVAVQYILTGATNDALALVGHVDRLDGRSAAHAARALFEHLVNLCGILEGGEDASERYLDHRHVTSDRISRHRWYLKGLDRKAARKERNRLDGLESRTKRPLADALEKYGSGFWRGWAAETLKNRADEHGLMEGYEGYRILSSVIHGSSGAMAGIVKSFDDRPIHRIGPDIDLAATAYAEGLHSFWMFMERIESVVSVTEVEEIVGRTGGLLNHLQQVRETLERVDKRMWPRNLPPATMTVAGIWPSGVVRWYLHDLRDNSIVRANLTDPEPDLTEHLKTAEQHDVEAYGGRPRTVGFPEIRATARPGAPRVPAVSVIVPADHPSIHWLR